MLHAKSLIAARTRMTTTLTQMRLPTAAIGVRSFSADNFMNGTNANYIDYMYSQWQKDPASVHPSWNAYFAGEEGGASISFEAPPTLGKTAGDAQLSQLISMLQSGAGTGVASSGDTARVADESIRLTMLLRAFMTHGHLVAEIDPLNLREVYKDAPSLAKRYKLPGQEVEYMLDPAHYGFTA